jgi:type VI secretion system protein ImpA
MKTEKAAQAGHSPTSATISAVSETRCYSQNHNRPIHGPTPFNSTGIAVLANSATIDLSSLLAPLSGRGPCGEDLRLDTSPQSLYYQLKDLRSAARAAERRADSDGDSQALSTEWHSILQLATEILANQSKDLEVVAWLIEALVRAHGFAGLRDGFCLATGFVEQYWDTFHSLQDEEGLETRLAPLSGLNGTLTQPLRKVPLTIQTDAGRFAVYHYDQALALSQVSDPEARARREAAGEVTLAQFTAAANASGGKFYSALLDDIDGCQAHLERLGYALDERAGRDSPSTIDIRNVITNIQDSVRQFSADLVARATATASLSGDVANGGDNSIASNSNDRALANGVVSGREDALRILLQVAAYFRTHEPHSPISNSLEEVVRRARMPFAELLAELLPDQNTWRSMLTSAGIKPPAE